MPSVGCFEKLGMCLGFLLLPLGAFYVWKYEGINEEYCTPGVYAAETLTVEASCLYNAGNNEKPVHLSCPVVTDDSSVVEPVTGATIQSLTYSSVLAVQTSAAAWGWHETHYDETMIADEDDNGEKFDCYCYFLEWSQNHKAIDSSHLDHICQLGALANTHRLACPDTADSPTKADIDKFNDLLEPELRLGTWTAYAEHAKLGTDDGDYQFSLTKEQIKETVGLVEVDALDRRLIRLEMERLSLTGAGSGAGAGLFSAAATAHLSTTPPAAVVATSSFCTGSKWSCTKTWPLGFLSW